MTMDFFLPKHEQAVLRAKLEMVPHLVEELAITITRQARIQRTGLGKPRRQKPGSRLPFHLAASDAADELHNCLVTWTRFVCEGRQINYNGHDDDLSLARWLRRNMTALAITEGSEEACEDISARVDECQRQIDLPPEDAVVIDRGRVKEANRQVLTAGQVERIACKLGPLGVGLNKRRVESLARNGALSSCGRDGEVRFYRLGDVLDAHHRVKRRATKARPDSQLAAEG